MLVKLERLKGRHVNTERLCAAWFTIRRYRLTASRFGDVISRKPSTPPDKLILNILQPTNFTSEAMKYGIDNEKCAKEAYITWQHDHGHPDLVVPPSGFLINPLYSLWVLHPMVLYMILHIKTHLLGLWR